MSSESSEQEGGFFPTFVPNNNQALPPSSIGMGGLSPVNLGSFTHPSDPGSIFSAANPFSPMSPVAQTIGEILDNPKLTSSSNPFPIGIGSRGSSAPPMMNGQRVLAAVTPNARSGGPMPIPSGTFGSLGGHIPMGSAGFAGMGEVGEFTLTGKTGPLDNLPSHIITSDGNVINVDNNFVAAVKKSYNNIISGTPADEGTVKKYPIGPLSDPGSAIAEGSPRSRGKSGSVSGLSGIFSSSGSNAGTWKWGKHKGFDVIVNTNGTNTRNYTGAGILFIEENYSTGARVGPALTLFKEANGSRYADLGGEVDRAKDSGVNPLMAAARREAKEESANLIHISQNALKYSVDLADSTNSMYYRSYIVGINGGRIRTVDYRNNYNRISGAGGHRTYLETSDIAHVYLEDMKDILNHWGGSYNTKDAYGRHITIHPRTVRVIKEALKGVKTNSSVMNKAIDNRVTNSTKKSSTTTGFLNGTIELYLN